MPTNEISMIPTLALLAIQGLLGAFDNLWHHELRVQLPSRPSAQRELRLHALRAAFYAPVFLSIAWTRWEGWLAVALAALLVAEVGVTLTDFIEEDRTRHLPASERILHTLLAMNYGGFLGLLAPQLMEWWAAPTGIIAADYGGWSWLMTIYAAGAAAWGIRDALASWRLSRSPLATWQRHRFQVRRRLDAHTFVVTGATGFIGRALCRRLIERGDHVIVLARDRAKAINLFGSHAEVVDSLDRIALSRRIDGVVNLAGEAIAERPWTPTRKALLIESRVGTTRAVVEWLARLQRQPRVLVSASAVGWYGTHEHRVFTEHDAAGKGFASALCASWEREALRARHRGVRVTVLRFGIVLGAGGGLLARMLPVYRLGLGARLGDGRQWMPWLHLEDALCMLDAALSDERWHGVVNAVAPEFISNQDFSEALARAVNRPLWFAIPAWMLRRLLGEMATLLVEGQRVAPSRVAELGYRFRFPTLQQALAKIAQQPSAAMNRAVEHA
jgi:uncharacterized protein (TIGR01777 family)